MERQTICIKLVSESEFLGREAVRKTMHPDFAISLFRAEPHASFWQPGLRLDFIGSRPDTAASIFECAADQVWIKIGREITQRRVPICEQCRHGRANSANDIPVVLWVILTTPTEEFAILITAFASLPSSRCKILLWKFLARFEGCMHVSFHRRLDR